ncbi:MAG: serine hydrolase, partial [Chloroflexota bacterium]|nr:serine hydrolase [Chloroflexota bacterium]
VAVGLVSLPALQLERSMEQRAESWRVQSNVAGVVVAVDRAGEFRAAASGDSDRTSRAPLRVDGQFRIGSISKSFVSATALQLVEDGRLQLDQSLADYGVGPAWVGPVTVRQLLANRSGIAEFENDAFFADAATRLDRRYAPLELIERFAGDHLLFPPGSRFEYSNSNFVLAGLLIERVTSSSLESEIQRRFLVPLALHATGFSASPGLVAGYSRAFAAHIGRGSVDTRTLPAAAIESASWAGGMMISNARDLATWVRALYGGHVLTPATQSELLAFDAAFGDYGLGTYRKTLPPGVAYGHGGIYFGYLAEAWYLPGQNSAIVALANDDAGDLGGLVADEARLVFGDSSDSGFDVAVTRLHSSDAAARRDGALALGKADPTHAGQAVVLLLGPLANDPEPGVRGAAALALGLVGRFDRTRSTDALRAASGDADAGVRDAAARALAALAGPAP